MKHFRILVVEDDAVIGMLLSEMLTEMGHEVCGLVETEAEAVAAASKYKPDMMIVDAILIDGSGFAAVAQICRIGFVAHVFVSGDVARVKPQTPLGAVILQKPYREADLARAMDQAKNAA